MTFKEKAARALVWDHFQGCVSWDDSADPATTGDEQTRAYALRDVETVARHMADALRAADYGGELTEDEAAAFIEREFGSITPPAEAGSGAGSGT